MIVVAGHVVIDSKQRDEAEAAAREMKVQRCEVANVGRLRP